MATVVATATNGEILVKFFDNDTVGFFLQTENDTEHVATYPIKVQLKRDRAIAAKHNGNIFGRERALVNKVIELYLDEPEIEAIA